MSIIDSLGTILDMEMLRGFSNAMLSGDLLMVFKLFHTLPCSVIGS